jgi:hypothetical membrane protein
MGVTVQGGEERSSALRRLAWAGVVGPVVFSALVVVLGLLRPGYSQASQAISELGQAGAPNAVIQDANFIIFGLLTIMFAIGLHASIGGERRSALGPALVAIFGGVGAIGAGIFPLPSPLHQPVSVAGFIAMMAATFALSRRVRQDPRWQGYDSYSWITGAIAVGLFLALLFLGLGALMAWFGALQRLFLAPLFVWIEIMALRAVRLLALR